MAQQATTESQTNKSTENKGTKKKTSVKLPNFIQQFLQLFKRNKAPLPPIGGHMGVKKEDLDWNKKEAKHWFKILSNYHNRLEKNEKEASVQFYREIRNYGEHNHLYLKYFSQEIWEARLNPITEIQDLFFELIPIFLDENLDFFEKEPSLIYGEIEAEENERRRELGEGIFQKIWESNPEWVKRFFSDINSKLINEIEVLKITAFQDVYGEDSSSSAKKRRRSQGKRSKKDRQQTSDTEEISNSTKFYYFIWTEILSKNPDILINEWTNILNWMFEYDKQQQREQSQSDYSLSSILPQNNPTLLDYQLELLLENIEKLIEKRDLPSNMAVDEDSIGLLMVNQLVSFILINDPKETPYFSERILEFVTLYIHQNPEILDDYHQISVWINQENCHSLPNILFSEIFEQVVQQRRVDLCDKYISDFLTHLSYAGELMIKRTIQLLYFLHNEFNFFSHPQRFSYLVYALDQENPQIQEHVHFLIFTIVKNNPELFVILKPKIEVGLHHNAGGLERSTIFFLQLLNEIILNCPPIPILTDIFTSITPLFMERVGSPKIDYLIAYFFDLITNISTEFLSPYREWIDRQIMSFSDIFEIKSLYSNIRIKLIRATLKMKDVTNLL